MGRNRKETWWERFAESLQRFKRGIESEDTDCADEPYEGARSIRACAVSELSQRWVEGVEEKLWDAEDACESPIERVMLHALIVACRERFWEIGIRKCPPKDGDNVFDTSQPAEWYYGLQPYPDAVVIELQKQVGNYRCDFFLTADSPAAASMTRQPLDALRTSLIVECDGHDFHERTKEQASRDKERDRELQKLGFRVFRYSGADLWRDPVRCAAECADFLNDELRKRWQGGVK